MSSKRRVRESQCTGKTRFQTKEAAEAMALEVARRPVRPGERVGRYRAYHCVFCEQFHFGHLPVARNHRPWKQFKG
jgi:hypothetical protein